MENEKLVRRLLVKTTLPVMVFVLVFASISISLNPERFVGFWPNKNSGYSSPREVLFEILNCGEIGDFDALLELTTEDGVESLKCLTTANCSHVDVETLQKITAEVLKSPPPTLIAESTMWSFGFDTTSGHEHTISLVKTKGGDWALAHWAVESVVLLDDEFTSELEEECDKIFERASGWTEPWEVEPWGQAKFEEDRALGKDRALGTGQVR